MVGDTNEDEDEDLISILTMFIEEGVEWERQQEINERLRMNEGIQTKVSDWFKVTRIERKRKVEPKETVTKELKQTTLWQCLEGRRRSMVGEGEVNGQGAGEIVDHISAAQLHTTALPCSTVHCRASRPRSTC